MAASAQLAGGALTAAREARLVAALADISARHFRMVAHHRHGDLMAYFKLNQGIHEAIVAASRNKTLTQTYRTLNARIARATWAI